MRYVIVDSKFMAKQYSELEQKGYICTVDAPLNKTSERRWRKYAAERREQNTPCRVILKDSANGRRIAVYERIGRELPRREYGDLDGPFRRHGPLRR